MALSDEQTKRLITRADGMAQKEGSVFRALVKLTEAEVRKDCEPLIRQMLEALEMARNAIGHPDNIAALVPSITAACAWLDGAATQQPGLVPLADVLRRVDACAGPGSAVRLALEREFGQPAA